MQGFTLTANTDAEKTNTDAMKTKLQHKKKITKSMDREL